MNSIGIRLVKYISYDCRFGWTLWQFHFGIDVNDFDSVRRKFQSKRECKIQYESSCELLVDEEMEQDTNGKSDIRTDATADTKQCTEAPKRKLRSKLNL